MEDPIARLVEEHLWLADRIIASMTSRLPAHVDRHLLRSGALGGLLEAARNFDPAMGRFDRYAPRLIRGRALDAIRQNDHAPRRTRTRQRERGIMRAELAQRLGRRPSAAELEEALGWDPAAIRSSQPAGLFSIHEPASDEKQLHEARKRIELGDILPARNGHRDDAEIWRRFAAALAGLDPRTRLIITRNFADGETLKAIGADLGISESRCSQLITKALAWLRQARSRDEILEALR